MTSNDLNDLETSARPPANKTVLYIVLVAGVIVIGTLATFFYLSSRTQDVLDLDGDININETTTIQDLYQSLIAGNDAFKEGERLLRLKEYDTARSFYTNALDLAENVNEEGQIKYKIATVDKLQRNFQTAADGFKEIIADGGYSDQQRAYAVQSLGDTYYRANDPKTTQHIFTGEPYATFMSEAEGNTAIAVRKLYEYGSSFRPLAIAEARIGFWYAVEIGKLSRRDELTEEEEILKEEYTQRVRDALLNIDSDIARTQNLPNAGSLIPEALARKATVIAIMTRAGETSTGDPIEAFDTALNASLLRGPGTDSSVRYAYAAHLMLTDVEGSTEKIKSLLSPFYTDRDAYSLMLRFFSNQRGNTLGEKNIIKRLGGVDPQFEALLRDLGWTEDDF